MSKTKVIKVDAHSPDEKTIEFAATLLRDGGLVAFPTETVYGLGVNLENEKAVKKLYEVKNRPLDKPFTVHISSLDMIEKMDCEISPLADQLIKKFWPGPLTIILKSDKGKFAFRMPKNTVAKELISKSSVPVAAPSANLSGEKPPSEVSTILKEFDGKIDLILDAGKTEFGKESTIVDTTITPYKILRIGAVEKAEIDQVFSEVS